MMNVVFSIQYAGMMLPVSKNQQGQDVTPLKPISDLFGLKWQSQRKKIMESDFYMRHLGISGTDISTGNGQKEGNSGDSGRDIPTSNHTYLEEIFIRIDRVAAYLMTINPERVRSHGNIQSADYLEQKMTEWANALHDYEELGIAINMNHVRAQDALRKQRTSFVQYMGVLNKTPEMTNRRAITEILKQVAGEIGIEYQPDLLDKS